MTNKEETHKIAVLTSGGDSPGMNSAIRAILLSCEKKNYVVYGIKDGYFGLYHDLIEILNFNTFPLCTINRAGTYLGTTRFLPFQQDLSVRQKCVKNLQNKGINKLIIIGGDGSYRGAMKLEELGIQCIGVPATIDNDIQKTDLTIGFSTAVNNVLDAIEKVRDTSLSHNRCTLIEVMGRNKGDLALYGGLATCSDIIITKENLISKQLILDKIKNFKIQNKRHVIIVVTEHIFDVYKLAKEVESYSGFETRAQVLGHIQRGGTPTVEDRILATQMGNYAVNLLKQNIHNCAVAIQKQEIIHIDFNNILDVSNVRNKLYDIL